MGTLLLIDITLSHNHHVIHWFRVKTAKYFLKYYHIYVAINNNVVCKNDTKDEINILGIQYNYNNTKEQTVHILAAPSSCLKHM